MIDSIAFPLHVRIASATLAVNVDGTPAAFTSKAVVVPHLHMVIAGTGVAGFSTRWFARVNDHMTVRDMDHLDFHAPKCPGSCRRSTSERHDS